MQRKKQVKNCSGEDQFNETTTSQPSIRQPHSISPRRIHSTFISNPFRARNRLAASQMSPGWEGVVLGRGLRCCARRVRAPWLESVFASTKRRFLDRHKSDANLSNDASTILICRELHECGHCKITALRLGHSEGVRTNDRRDANGGDSRRPGNHSRRRLPGSGRSGSSVSVFLMHPKVAVRLVAAGVAPQTFLLIVPS